MIFHCDKKDGSRLITGNEETWGGVLTKNATHRGLPMLQHTNEEAAVLEAADRWVKALKATAGEADQNQLETAKASLVDAVKAWRASRPPR